MNDNINHPKHYNQGKIEVIEFIEDKNLGFHLGNVVKYVARAGIKTETVEGLLEDLKKARWYLDRKIELLASEDQGREPVRPNDMTESAPEPDFGRCEGCGKSQTCVDGVVVCSDPSTTKCVLPFPKTEERIENPEPPYGIDFEDIRKIVRKSNS